MCQLRFVQSVAMSYSHLRRYDGLNSYGIQMHHQHGLSPSMTSLKRSRHKPTRRYILIELVVRVMLTFTLTVEQFLIIGPIVQYSFLGVMLLVTLLCVRIRRYRKRNLPERLSREPVQETSHTSV